MALAARRHSGRTSADVDGGLPLFALLSGALAGLLHVVSGPDHLIAVAPIAVENPRLGLRVGFFWGLGHATGALAVGALGWVARRWLDVSRLSAHAEFVVGLMLVGIGLWSLWKAKRLVLHRHKHLHTHAGALVYVRRPAHMAKVNWTFPNVESLEKSPASDSQPAPLPHEHLHVHAAGAPHTSASHHHHSGGSFSVGLLHGAAGTGHLLAVIPSLALPPAQSAAYLAAYGVAAVSAMSGFGWAMGSVGHRLEPGTLRRVMTLAGVAAVVLGIYWMLSWQATAA